MRSYDASGKPALNIIGLSYTSVDTAMSVGTMCHQWATNASYKDGKGPHQPIYKVDPPSFERWQVALKAREATFPRLLPMTRGPWWAQGWQEEALQSIRPCTVLRTKLAPRLSPLVTRTLG